MIDLDLVEPVENIPVPIRFSPSSIMIIVLLAVMMLSGSIPLDRMKHYTPPTKPREYVCSALTMQFPACRIDS